MFKSDCVTPPPYCTSALVSSLYDYHASLRYKLWASRPA